MPFESETKFERHVRELLESEVLPKLQGVSILGGKKGVDICLYRDGQSPAIFFIEVKYFNRSKNHSMVALGSGTGDGFQPATLSQQPEYLESHLRWVIGTAENDLYYYLSTVQALPHLSGGVIGRKQNGFNRSIFTKEQGLSRALFIESLTEWLRTA